MIRSRHGRRGLRAALLTILAAGLLAAIAQPAAGAPVPGRYIVVLKGGTGDPAAVGRDQHGRFGVGVGHVYRYALRGFAATIPASRLGDVRRDPRVAFVSQDRTVRATGTQTLTSGDSIPTGVLRAGAAAGTTAHHPSRRAARRCRTSR